MSHEIQHELQRLQDQISAVMQPTADNTPMVERLQKQVQDLAAKVASLPRAPDEDVLKYRVERSLANEVSNQVAQAAGELAAEMASELQSMEAAITAKSNIGVARLEADLLGTKALATQQTQIAVETILQAGYRYAHA